MKFNFDPASRKLMDIIIRWIVVALVLKDNIITKYMHGIHGPRPNGESICP